VETQELRKAGLKVTHPRMRILEILEDSSGNHMTAEDIYRRLIDHDDEIGLATVYRVLTQFEAAGLIVKHNFEGGQAVYEINRGKHHDHMVRDRGSQSRALRAGQEEEIASNRATDAAPHDSRRGPLSLGHE
jgi:Fe2+ or Zn2+ uptake regulation protein